MDKKVVKTIRKDCHRMMWPCYVVHGLHVLIGFLVPTLAAWLVGSMTDALLALDISYIKVQLPPFFTAVFLEAVALPLLKMLDGLVMVQRAGCYETFLMERLLHRPLSALCGETGATVAEHTMIHTPDYYFIQICKFTLPVTILIYGTVLLAVLFMGELHPVFVAAIALLAAIPLLRTALIGNLNAKVTADERRYETERAQKEESLFYARSFFRVNRLAEDCLGRFHRRFEEWYRCSGPKKNNVAAIRAVFDYICGYGASLGVIFVGAVLVLTGKMRVGALMTGYLLLPTLASFYRTISVQVEEIQKERDSQARLAVFYGKRDADLESTEGSLPSEAPPAGQIRLNHVTFTYPGEDVPAIVDWSGNFSSGETIRLVGKNGSGKTTLVRLLAGLYAPQSGTITDEEGTVLSKEALRRLITIQEQDGCIFQGTVWDNLFTNEDRRDQAQAYLRLLGFDKPLEYTITAGASNLSPGERQKLLLTRSLLREAKFLVVDEPLNNMDAAGAESLLTLLQLRKGGLILITHQNIPLPSQTMLTLDIARPEIS